MENGKWKMTGRSPDDPLLFKLSGLAAWQADDDLVSFDRLDLDLSMRGQFDHVARHDSRLFPLAPLAMDEKQIDEIGPGHAFRRARLLGGRDGTVVAMAALFQTNLSHSLHLPAEIFEHQLPPAFGALRVKRHPFQFFTVALAFTRVF